MHAVDLANYCLSKKEYIVAKQRYGREDGEFIGRHGRDQFGGGRRATTGHRERDAVRPQSEARGNPALVQVPKASNNSRKGVGSTIKRQDVGPDAAVKVVEAIKNEFYDGRQIYKVAKGDFKGRYCYFTGENDFMFINR